MVPGIGLILVSAAAVVGATDAGGGFDSRRGGIGGTERPGLLDGLCVGDLTVETGVRGKSTVTSTVELTLDLVTSFDDEGFDDFGAQV